MKKTAVHIKFQSKLYPINFSENLIRVQEATSTEKTLKVLQRATDPKSNDHHLRNPKKTEKKPGKRKDYGSTRIKKSKLSSKCKVKCRRSRRSMKNSLSLKTIFSRKSMKKIRNFENTNNRYSFSKTYTYLGNGQT